MKIRLSVDSYKGVDGSSLSPTRCSQMVQVYEMLEQMGAATTSYIGIQEEADRKDKSQKRNKNFLSSIKED